MSYKRVGWYKRSADASNPMQVPIHLATSWLIGQHLPERCGRRLVTWSGVVPDLDALSLVGGAAAYSEYQETKVG